MITIASDCGSNWYSGTGTPASTQCDLLSTVTHEIGHGVGHVFHFNDVEGITYDPSVCKPNVGDDDAETMCSGDYVPSDSTFRRTLGVHDRGTLNNAYANWPAQPASGLPPPDGGPPPYPDCAGLDETGSPRELIDGTVDAIGDALVAPDDANIYGSPVCAR